MGIRFSKYLTLGKLIRINLSKSGISATIGVKGASINIGQNGVYLNTGIPGTGIHSREKIFKGGKVNTSQSAITRAKNTLEEYDKERIKCEENSRKSDIAPNVNIKELDKSIMDIAYFVVSEDCPSTSQIKRKFGLSYTQAGKVTEILERNGIISQFSPTCGRKVLISINAFNELKNKLSMTK